MKKESSTNPRDEAHFRALYRLYPIKKYILDRYPTDAIDASDPINEDKIKKWGSYLFLGLRSTPIAIELSQWGYSVSVMGLDEASRTKIELEADYLAGLFRNVTVGDYLSGHIPAGDIVFAIDELNLFETEEVIDILEEWLSNNREIIVVLPKEGNWLKVLRPRFSVFKLRMINDDIFLSITKK